MLDLVIHGASVLDGTGSPGFPAWVGIQGERIVALGRDDRPPEAARTVEASGRVLAPGSIDVHNHSDVGPLVEPWMDSTVRQGVTTVVVGNCGTSPWPAAGAHDSATMMGVRAEDLDMAWPSFGNFLDALDSCRPAANIAALVGHGAVRGEVMGMQRRAPTTEELTAMRGFVADAMEGGAIGLSTGLIYVPGMYSGTDEVVELAATAAPFGGVYASHIRGEGENLFAAVREAIDIGERAGIPAHVSHLKCETEMVIGKTAELLALFEGRDATADQYPYTAWGSVLWSLLPDWAPVEELQEVLSDPDRRARLTHVVENGEGLWQSSIKGVGWDKIVIESTADDRWNGKDMVSIADSMGLTPADAMYRLLLEEPETACIGHAMDEDDVQAILARPEIMVASDATSMSPEGPLGAFPVHPRNYGTFPRVLGRYVRDLGVLSLETAVAKMTSLPADRFGLVDRGRVAEGGFADLVVFDPATVADTADFGAPHSYPEGFDLVVVNGRVAWDGERRERAGRILRRS